MDAGRRVQKYFISHLQHIGRGGGTGVSLDAFALCTPRFCQIMKTTISLASKASLDKSSCCCILKKAFFIFDTTKSTAFYDFFSTFIIVNSDEFFIDVVKWSFQLECMKILSDSFQSKHLAAMIRSKTFSSGELWHFQIEFIHSKNFIHPDKNVSR